MIGILKAKITVAAIIKCGAYAKEEGDSSTEQHAQSRHKKVNLCNAK
jgi:hypothetical protein